MKIKRKTYIIILSSITLACLIIIFYSCEEKIITDMVDCSECYTEKPDSSDLIISFSEEKADTNGIQIFVYKGNIEDNHVIFLDTIYTELFYLYVPVNQFYAVKAYYFTPDSQRYTVINGTNLKIKHVTEECDEPCWVFTGQKVDMRIKYTQYFN